MQFTLNGQSGPTVAGLVTRLDGMPLAIEVHVVTGGGMTGWQITLIALGAALVAAAAAVLLDRAWVTHRADSITTV